MFGFAAIIALASVILGGPVLAAVRLDSARLVQFAQSTAFEPPVLALIGMGFLAFAFAVRRLQTPTRHDLS
jgi:hypothetical protein